MSSIRSFDVFDTLLARRYINSDIIWETMESDYSIPGFASSRKASDTGSRNLKEIYDVLANIGLITNEQAKTMLADEILREQQLAFPIKENLAKVRNGDLLVSDMYMQAPDILNLVRSVGLDKQVTIYQSNGDKSTGAFWRTMQGKLDLEYHIGDNVNSDYNMPRNYGFNAVHYSNTNGLTSTEDYLISIGLKHLGFLIREIRLSNYEPDHTMFFEIASQKNLLLLFLFCEILRRKHGDRPIAFLGRDCQLTQKVYSAYFGVQSYYLPFSREVAFKCTDNAVEYLKTHLPSNPALVDISSTGRTWEVICSQHPFDVEVFIYSDTYWYSKDKPQLPANFNYIHANSVIGSTSIVLEVFNCGDHGKINNINIVNGVPVCEFGETELPLDVIDVIHKPVNNAVELRNRGYYSQVTSELSLLDDETLSMMSSQLLTIISNTPIMQLNENGVMDSFNRQEESYLDAISE